MRRRGRDVLAAQGHRARADRDQPEQGLEQRGLAGAVGADDADQLAVLQVEVAPAQDVDAGHVAGDQVVGPDQGTLGELDVLLAGGGLLGRGELARSARASSARVTSSPDSSTSNSGSSLIGVGAVRPSLAWSSAAEAVTVGHALLAGDRGLRLGEDPVLLLDGQRRVVVGTEVGVDDGLVLADRLRRALGDDLAGGHDDHPVADVADDVHVVLDEDHGHALLAQVLDVTEQALGQRRVHPGHRLVEHDDLAGRSSARGPSPAACADRRTGCRRSRPSWRRA